MVSIDIEHFKMFNEWYGFKEGDNFLIDIASNLNEIDKNVDTIVNDYYNFPTVHKEYERDSKGSIRLLDSQNNLVIDLLNPAHRKWFDEQWDSKFVTYDMSNSSVNLDAVELFENIIKI